MKLMDYTIFGILFATTNGNVFAQTGFVALPKIDTATDSAYISCNPTGKLGHTNSIAPKDDSNNVCSVTSQELVSNITNAPLGGFRLIGVVVSDIPITTDYSSNQVVGILSEAIWRNKNNTECILATHIQMKDEPLSNGQYWEINDIVHAGFSKNDIAVAYFYKPYSTEEGGNTEVLFRAGRTFTSVKNFTNNSLPTTKNAPAANTAFSTNNTAAISDNWVTFTTDLSFKDSDISSRAISSMFYIKYSCDARDPVSKPNAIHLRSTQNEISPTDIAIAGLVPVDTDVEQY